MKQAQRAHNKHINLRFECLLEYQWVRFDRISNMFLRLRDELDNLVRERSYQRIDRISRFVGPEEEKTGD